MKYFSFLLLIAVLAGSCNIVGKRVKGNGKMTTQNYDVKDFSSIGIGGSKEIILKQDSSFSVKVETDENLLKHLTVRVDDGVLKVISERGLNLNPSDEIKIFVSMPEIEKINVSGASTIKTENKFTQNDKINIELSGASEGTLDVRAPVVDIRVSGASTLTISGETRDVRSRASGASTINSYNLKSENTDADASGASSIELFASISLKADASGASGIDYKGNPATVKEKANGGSDVKKAD